MLFRTICFGLLIADGFHFLANAGSSYSFSDLHKQYISCSHLLTMPSGRVPKPLQDLGEVGQCNLSFFAHVQYLDGATKKMNIKGPYRSDAAQAQADLDDMRACAALFGEDREKGLVAMKAEARRIQERAEHDREIRLAA